MKVAINTGQLIPNAYESPKSKFMWYILGFGTATKHRKLLELVCTVFLLSSMIISHAVFGIQVNMAHGEFHTIFVL